MDKHPLANLEISPDIIFSFIKLDKRGKVITEAEPEVYTALHNNPAIPLLALENPDVAIIADWAKRHVLEAEQNDLQHRIYLKTRDSFAPIEKAIAVLEEIRPHLWRVHPLIKSLVEIYLDFGPLGSFHQSLNFKTDTFAEDHQTMANETLLEPMLKLHRERRLYTGNQVDRQRYAEDRQAPLNHVSPWILIQLQHAAWMIQDEHRVSGEWRWDFNAPMVVIDSMMAGLRVQYEDMMQGNPARREWYPQLLLEACREQYLIVLAEQLRPNTLGLELKYNPFNNFLDIIQQLARVALIHGITAEQLLTA